MKILAVDTATQSCSVAVIADASLRAELTALRSETHSRHLARMIESAMSLAGLQLDALDGLAVSIGPGSFTGLRIGISSVKGLAFALRKPVVGVSTLAALAWQCGPSPYLICPLVDARKQQVYCGRFRFGNGRFSAEQPERAASPGDAVADINETCLFVGDGARLYQSEIEARLGRLALFAAQGQHIIRASTIAWLSRTQFEQNQTHALESLVPHYIRKSDAELNLAKRR